MKHENKSQRYTVGSGASLSHHRTLKGARRAAQAIANRGKHSVHIIDTSKGRHVAATVKPRAARRRKRSSGGLFGGLF